jgi:glyoxylase-like metal-dependent hydrolase (beta-lactamase superfamily II)
VWLVDCGDAESVERWLSIHGKTLKGVFLTHCHDDHTFGLRRLLKEMPALQVFLSAHKGVECVQDTRLNLSKFTPEPFQIFTDHFVELKNGEEVTLFPDTELTAIQVDGHSPDSMAYRVGTFLFTGDAYIPPLEVVTKLPGADKERAAASLAMIKMLVETEKLTVLPGHEINS